LSARGGIAAEILTGCERSETVFGCVAAVL
jgi:hypothetical protein